MEMFKRPFWENIDFFFNWKKHFDPNKSTVWVFILHEKLSSLCIFEQVFENIWTNLFPFLKLGHLYYPQKMCVQSTLTYGDVSL